MIFFNIETFRLATGWSRTKRIGTILAKNNHVFTGLHIIKYPKTGIYFQKIRIIFGKNFL